MLRNDEVLGSVLPNTPPVVFRGVALLRLQIAPNVVDLPKTIYFFHTKGGFFPCRRCSVCRINALKDRRVEYFQSNSNQKKFKIKPFISCTTRHVVNLLRCPCGLEYIGRTIRMLHVRLKEHVTNIINGFPKHSVSRHYDQCHAKDPKGTVFIGIDKYTGCWRGSNMTRGVSRLEGSWIYNARTYTPFGLNIDWDVNAFISNA